MTPSDLNLVDLYLRDQRAKDDELRDLRILVAALVDKAGGKVTLKHSRLMELLRQNQYSPSRMPVEIWVDDKYDSVELRTPGRMDSEQTVEE